MEKKLTFKEKIYKEVQEAARLKGLNFTYCDAFEKEELNFFLNMAGKPSSCTYYIQYDLQSLAYYVHVKAAQFSPDPDKRYFFADLPACMECIAALQNFYSTIMETVKYF